MLFYCEIYEWCWGGTRTNQFLGNSSLILSLYLLSVSNTQLFLTIFLFLEFTRLIKLFGIVPLFLREQFKWADFLLNCLHSSISIPLSVAIFRFNKANLNLLSCLRIEHLCCFFEINLHDPISEGWSKIVGVWFTDIKLICTNCLPLFLKPNRGNDWVPHKIIAFVALKVWIPKLKVKLLFDEVISYLLSLEAMLSSSLHEPCNFLTHKWESPLQSFIAFLCFNFHKTNEGVIERSCIDL